MDGRRPGAGDAGAVGICAPVLLMAAGISSLCGAAGGGGWTLLATPGRGAVRRPAGTLVNPPVLLTMRAARTMSKLAVKFGPVPSSGGR